MYEEKENRQANPDIICGSGLTLSAASSNVPVYRCNPHMQTLSADSRARRLSSFPLAGYSGRCLHFADILRPSASYCLPRRYFALASHTVGRTARTEFMLQEQDAVSAKNTRTAPSVGVPKMTAISRESEPLAAHPLPLPSPTPRPHPTQTRRTYAVAQARIQVWDLAVFLASLPEGSPQHLPDIPPLGFTPTRTIPVTGILPRRVYDVGRHRCREQRAELASGVLD
ncbi:hypothetical protein MVEN_01301000 [Mycena venus]|uniref:Uncharacterized protein n=1 Tax=Mycena venus TaxID=2733690 RepID=A0A8H6XXC9_9AGAR|nr:hypothetical protein MVEN_01301000 [Mycena venus]